MDKRLHLANKVEKLAYCGRVVPNSDVLIPKHINKITEIPNRFICKEINKAHVSLCLSEIEGGCKASSESLLCGVPVISTPSVGGRDLWYNESNSIICEPNEDSVKNAVEKALCFNWDAEQIRNDHIKLAETFREKLASITQEIFINYNVDVDAKNILLHNIQHSKVLSGTAYELNDFVEYFKVF